MSPRYIHAFRHRHHCYVTEGEAIPGVESHKANRDQILSVEFAVTDDGIGMDRESLALCTNPFFTTKSSNSDNGLGLAMTCGSVR